MVQSHSRRFLQSQNNRIAFDEISFLVVNHERTVIESISRRINLKPSSHVRIRPCQTTPNSAILLEVIPMFKEKPEIHALALLRNRLPTLATPGLPITLPSIFNFIKGSRGAIHLMILGVLILIVLSGQAKYRYFVANRTEFVPFFSILYSNF